MLITTNRLRCRCAGLVVAILCDGAAAEPDLIEPTFDEAVDDLDLAALLQTDLTVVSATKTAQTLAESPSVITVIRRKEIEERGFRNVAEALSSVPGLYINYDFVFHDVGVRGITGEMRGGSKLIKVMIDGRPVAFRNETTNFLGAEMIPVEAIERIEVIRGPGSALYGANAFLGVVNVVTRTGAEIDGTLVSGGLLLFNGGETHLGGDGAVLAGTQVGPVDVMFAFSQAHVDRSGLSAPCGSVYPDAADPCAEHERQAQDPKIFGRQSVGDVSRPRSLVASVKLDVAKIIRDDPRRFGVLSLLASYQEIDSVASWADWALLQRNDSVDADGAPAAPIEASVNRIGLRNTSLLLKYDLSILEDLVGLSMNVGLAEGGATSSDRLRDSSFTDNLGAPRERERYGYRSLDAAAEVRATVFERFLPLGDTGFVVDDVTLIGSADASADFVSYSENAFATPVPYVTSELDNVGALGQITASLFGRRVGLVGGVRQDSHRGALLSNVQLERLAATARDDLCDGRVCYDSFNYRAGATWSLFRHIGPSMFSGVLLDDLYVKLLHGTAFKAPDPGSLYHDDYVGNRPVRANAALRPQNVASSELVLGAQGVGKSLRAEVVLFQNALTDQVTFERVQGGVQAQNTLAVDTNGMEISVAADFQSIDGGASASLQSSTRRFDDSFSDRIPETFGYPDLMMAAHVGVDIPFVGGHIAFAGRMIGERVGHPLNGRGDNVVARYTLPGYVIGDVDLRTAPFPTLGIERPAFVTVSVRNILSTSYAMSGFQPFYGTDLPSTPRTVLVRFEQKL